MKDQQTDRCKECNGEMVEVGEILNGVEYAGQLGKILAESKQTLYQCEDCKTIKIK